MDTLSEFSAQDVTRMPSVARGEAGVHEVSIVEATPQALAGLGRLVSRFDPADVTIVPWPVSGRRPLVPGTGNEGGVAVDRFVFERRGAIQYATNHAVGRRYLTGWFGDPATASEQDAPGPLLLTHEANYHPDGGQIFFPRDGLPYVALLAPPGDDVRPEHFVALRVPGNRGIHIDPGVWHQPIFPLAERSDHDDAQGRVHACVSVDFVGEWGLYLGLRLG